MTALGWFLFGVAVGATAIVAAECVWLGRKAARVVQLSVDDKRRILREARASHRCLGPGCWCGNNERGGGVSVGER